MNSKTSVTRPARTVAIVLTLVMLTVPGCSAVELYQSKTSATAAAEAGSAATENPTVSALAGALAGSRATRQSLSAGATQAAATIAILSSSPTAKLTADATPIPVSAETSFYGSVPIDSDRLNIIAALAFDADGQLLAATRAGEIYALPDRDGDGVADETRLIFADDEHALGQVSGLITRGEALILLNGARLSLLRDRDGDGLYEGLTQLAEGLPADQSPLQASNGIVEAPDGRLFTVDVKSGDILRIVPRE